MFGCFYNRSYSLEENWETGNITEDYTITLFDSNTNFGGVYQDGSGIVTLEDYTFIAKTPMSTPYDLRTLRAEGPISSKSIFDKSPYISWIGENTNSVYVYNGTQCSVLRLETVDGDFSNLKVLEKTPNGFDAYSFTVDHTSKRIYRICNNILDVFEVIDPE